MLLLMSTSSDVWLLCHIAVNYVQPDPSFSLPFIAMLLDNKAVCFISSYLRCLLFILCLKEQPGVLLMRGDDCKACQHNVISSGLLLPL